MQSCNIAFADPCGIKSFGAPQYTEARLRKLLTDPSGCLQKLVNAFVPHQAADHQEMRRAFGKRLMGKTAGVHT